MSAWRASGELCHTSRDGTSLKAICHAASELGLAARALKVSLRNLSEMPLPAIVHWEGNHWMVLVRRRLGARARGRSGGRGCASIPREEFERSGPGYAALFDYTEAFEQAPEAQSALHGSGPFLAGTSSRLRAGAAARGRVTLLELLFPVFTQMVVDTVIVENDVGLLNIILLAMAVALVFMQLANLVQEYLLSFAAVRIDAAILDFLTRQLLSLPLTLFQQPPHRRHPAPAGRGAAGAEFAVQHGIGGLLALSHARRRHRPDAGVQPVADRGLPGDDAGLCRR